MKTSEFKQDARTERLLKVYWDLIKNEKAVGVSDFASKCGYNRSSFSTIKNGRRNAPLSLLFGCVYAYNVRRDFLFDGQEPMFND